MCSWSERKSCYTEMYREYSNGEDQICIVIFSGPSCCPFNTSIWVPCHTGVIVALFIVIFKIILTNDVREFTVLLLIEGTRALYRWITKPIHSWWDIGVCLYSCTRSVWQLCNSGLFLLSLGLFRSWVPIYHAL